MLFANDNIFFLLIIIFPLDGNQYNKLNPIECNIIIYSW